MFGFASLAKPAARAQLNTDGMALVRRLLAKSEIAELRLLVDSLYSELEGCATFPNPSMEDQFKKFDAIWLEPLDEFLPKNNATLGVRYSRMVDCISEKIRRIFGREWYLYSHRSFFRRIGGGKGKVHVWHIDADAANIQRDFCVNVWLPLDRVGAELPSLEIIGGSHSKMRSIPISVENVPERDDAFISAMGVPSVPRLDPGDALVFDQFTLHRTQPIDGGTVRTSCELRFTKTESH